MNDRFRKDADRLLSDLKWKREDTRKVFAALEGKHPARTGKLRMSVVLAMLLVLATAVAVAVGLSQSPQYTAIHAARLALMDQYNLNVEMIKMFNAGISEEDGRTTITFTTSNSMFINREAVGEYTVVIDGKGKAAAAWSHDDTDPAVWKDGDLTSPVWGAPQLEQTLSRYAAYRAWWKENENIGELPLEKQETLFAQLREAVAPLELRESPEMFQPIEREQPPAVVPEKGADAESAVAAARKALEERYGLTEDMQTLFTVLPTKEAANGKDVWTVGFLPVSYDHPGRADWRWLHALTGKLGSYTVRLNADHSETLEVNWSLDNVEDSSAYTRSNWAQAKAYDARILPWVLELLERNAPIIAKYGEDHTEWFSVEDAAAYDQAFRDAGFDARHHNHGLPKAGDLSAEQALDLAKQAMSAEYGLTQEDLEAYLLTAEYLLEGEGVWSVHFWGSEGIGNVTLRASDGEIQMVTLDSGASGNG